MLSLLALGCASTFHHVDPSSQTGRLLAGDCTSIEGVLVDALSTAALEVGHRTLHEGTLRVVASTTTTTSASPRMTRFEFVLSGCDRAPRLRVGAAAFSRPDQGAPWEPCRTCSAQADLRELMVAFDHFVIGAGLQPTLY